MGFKKVLITGATGFIGSHLTRRLLQEGFDVGIIKRENSNTRRIEDIIENISVYETDLISTKDVSDTLSRFRPDVVFHLATHYAVEHEPEDISKMINTNVLGLVNLLDASRKNGVKLFVNTSTCFVYNESKEKLSEKSEIRPINLYAVTKKHAEDACSFYSERYKINIITLRLFPPYGPGDHERRLIPYIIKGYINNQKLNMTTGRQEWDFVFVDDVIDAYMKTLESEVSSPNEVFNVGTGRPESIRNIASIVENKYGTRNEISWGAVPHRKNELWFLCADTKKIEKHLNWNPKTSLRDGINLTLESFINQKGE